MMGKTKQDSLANNDQSFRPVTSSTCACEKGKASNECGNKTSEESSYESSRHHSLRGLSDYYCDDGGYGEKVDVGRRSGALTVPDGGWGWMVAVGSFVVMMLVPVLFPCFGILFSGYMLSKGTSSLTTAWIFNIQGFIWNIMGLFVRPLVDDIGWRGVGFVGITLVSISLLMSAFTPSPLFLFFSFSLLSGVGGGLVTSMCFLIVPIYFKRRRGMANAITMMGICSGEILGPLLVHLLLDEYGFLGACLIISAILLNGYIGILFFHPVEWHMRRNIYQVQNILTENSPIIQPLETDAKEDRIIIRLHKNNLIDNGLSILLKDSEMLKDQKAREINESQSLHRSLSSSSWNTVPASLIGYGTSLSESLHDVMKETRYNTTETLGKGSDSVISRICRFLRKVIGDLAVLRSPRAAIIATGNMLCMNSVLNFVMMVPFAMQALDHPLQDSARCISVSAFCNLLTRMVVSPLSDWTRFSKRLCYMGGYALLALSMFIFPMMSDLKWLEVTMGLFGCGLGANMALYNLVMIEYMGVDNLPTIFGASGLMVGLGFLVFGIISGLFRDVTGSYRASMWMLSAMAATSFSLWLLMPMAAAYDEKRRLQGGSTSKFEESSLSGTTYPSEAMHGANEQIQMDFVGEYRLPNN